MIYEHNRENTRITVNVIERTQFVYNKRKIRKTLA